MSDINPEEGQFLQDLETYRIFKGKDKPGIKEMIPFIRHTELPLLDYMTIRDLIEFSGCEDDTALEIILITMFAVLEEGSLCLDLDQERFLGRFSPDMKGKAVETISDFLAGLAEHRYNKIITSNGNEYMPLILEEYGGNRLLYFQKYYVHKSRLEERIDTFLREDASFDVQCREFDNILEEIYSPPLAIRVGKAGAPITKDPVQVKAIRLALRSGFSIISGGPGTGKTSLMVNILRCLVRAGIRVSDIILGAPTGRAAQRMTEAIQKNIATIEEPSSEDSSLLDLKGSTLHKILRYSSYKNDFYYRETNPLPASVVILDEVSMVDVVMLNRFLQALDPGKTRLILLGDKDQLPSVEAGSVFADMITDGTRAQKF